MKIIKSQVILITIHLFFIIFLITCATSEKNVKSIIGFYKSQKNEKISIIKHNEEKFKVIYYSKYGKIFYWGVIQDSVLKCKSDSATPINIKFSEDMNSLVINFNDERFVRVIRRKKRK